MKNRQLMRVQDGRGTVVRVHDGAVWITQEGDRRDYYVPARGSFTLTRDGLTLISALGRASIALTSPFERAAAARIEMVTHAARAGASA